MSDTLNSPQGDGNLSQSYLALHNEYVRHPQFPARGRKHGQVSRWEVTEVESDTLNSPQGDGNFNLSLV